MINPCSRLSTGDKSNLSKERERKQWMTGPSFMHALADGLWGGMQLNAKHLAVWLDTVPYDAQLAMAAIMRSGVQVTATPTEFVASVGWAQPAADNKAIVLLTEKKILSCLRAQCMKKAYSIEGAPDLSTAVNSVVVGGRLSPTYNEGDFKLTKPMADQSLPFRKSFVDKWLAPGVPNSLKDEFRALQVLHNKDFNKSGVVWEESDSKRKADGPLPGADAVKLAPSEGCPKSRADIQAAHGDIRMKEFTGWNLLVANDGKMFAEGGDQPQVVLASEPLAMTSGEWLTSTEYDKAKKQGARSWKSVGWHVAVRARSAECQHGIEPTIAMLAGMGWLGSTLALCASSKTLAKLPGRASISSRRRSLGLGNEVLQLHGLLVH